MSYPVEIKQANKRGWQTPQEARAWYGSYDRSGVTVHWWGAPGHVGNHDATVNYILGQAAQGVMSSNFVVSNTKITQLVAPDNVAFHATAGNPTTVGIEFEPTLNDEGYKRGGWLIAELERRYNRTLTLYPHKHWQATACPGTISLDRLRSEANKAKGTAPQPAPVPVPQGSKKMTRPEAEAVVRALYVNALGRQPDAGGLNNYVNHILAGRIDVPAREILASAEFVNRMKKRYTVTVTKPAPAQPGNPADAADAAKFRQARAVWQQLSNLFK